MTERFELRQMPRSVQFSRSSTIDDQASRSAASIPCIGQTSGMQDATADDLCISIGTDWPSQDGLSPMTYTVDCVYSRSRQVCQDSLLRSALSATTTAQRAASRSYMPVSAFSLNGADRTARVGCLTICRSCSHGRSETHVCVYSSVDVVGG